MYLYPYRTHSLHIVYLLIDLSLCSPSDSPLDGMHPPQPPTSGNLVLVHSLGTSSRSSSAGIRFLYSSEVMPAKEEYRHVPLDSIGSIDDEHSRLSAEFGPTLLKSYHHPHSRYWRVFGPLAWLVTTALLAALWIMLTAAVTRQPTDAECTARLSVWCKSFTAALQLRDLVLEGMKRSNLVIITAPTFEAVRYKDLQFERYATVLPLSLPKANGDIPICSHS